jgi:hypothetical protein
MDLLRQLMRRDKRRSKRRWLLPRHLAALLLQLVPQLRLVEEQQAPVSAADVAAAERSTISLAFGGSASAYAAALAQLHASRATARALIADDIRRVRIQASLAAPPPAAKSVLTFYAAYPTRLVRRVRLSAPAWWLGGSSSGYALQGIAPDRVFALPNGAATTIWTSSGPAVVTPLEDPEALGALPFSLAAAPIRTGLRWFSQADAFDTWTTSRQTAALKQTVCARDDLPDVGAIDPSAFVPFLAVNL